MERVTDERLKKILSREEPWLTYNESALVTKELLAYREHEQQDAKSTAEIQAICAKYEAEAAEKMPTKRELAAMAAMQGLLAKMGPITRYEGQTASDAVRYADALLAELTKTERSK